MERNCDIHKTLKGDATVPATVDGKTVMGPWAYMCNDCLEEFGYPNTPGLITILKEVK